uniref:Uncharacterized protein n=1 Tax=Oryza punctata TaxID=4537 RepID=A0A0E0ML59_ORYPU
MLREHGCEHIAVFPQMLKDSLPENISGIRAVLKDFCRPYWGPEGMLIGPDCHWEQLAKDADAEDPEQNIEPAVGAKMKAKLATDLLGRKVPRITLRVAKHELKIFHRQVPAKIKYPCAPVSREMIINGRGYLVLKVAKWMKNHPGRTLEDFDHNYYRCRVDTTLFR